MTFGVQAHIMWVQRQDAFKEKFAVEVEESAKNSSQGTATWFILLPSHSLEFKKRVWENTIDDKWDWLMTWESMWRYGHQWRQGSLSVLDEELLILL
jgi:hypothetical protein